MSSHQPRPDPERSTPARRPDGSQETVRRLLADWVKRGEGADRTLASWLQGLDLPASDRYEPFEWILGALPIGGERPRLEDRLAERLAALLARDEELLSSARHPARLANNALLLAAGLGARRILSAPLRALLERWTGRPELRPSDYLGEPATAALRTALARNQVDDSLRGDWFQLLETDGHPVLPGTATDGFTGVVLMPPDAEHLDSPALPDIERALDLLIARLPASVESEQDRERILKSQVQTMRTYHASFGHWDSFLAELAYVHSWPAWATRALLEWGRPIPVDCRWAGGKSSVGRELEREIAAYRETAAAGRRTDSFAFAADSGFGRAALASRRVQVLSTFADGAYTLFLCESPEAWQDVSFSFQALARHREQIRLDTPGGRCEAVSQALRELEVRARLENRLDEAGRIEDGRHQLLKDRNVLHLSAS